MIGFGSLGYWFRHEGWREGVGGRGREIRKMREVKRRKGMYE